VCYENHVFTLRCTQRLLTRIKGPHGDVAANEPTTRLGDWYANLLHLGRTQLVLAVSERTFLPVVISAAPAKTITMRLRDGVVDVLGALGVDSTSVNREVAEVETVVLGRTVRRQVTGVLVDFAKGLDIYFEHEPSLLACSIKLAETPCSPLDKTAAVSPERATAALFNEPMRPGDERVSPRAKTRNAESAFANSAFSFFVARGRYYDWTTCRPCRFTPFWREPVVRRLGAGLASKGGIRDAFLYTTRTGTKTTT
jgi:uncharacterized protein DUF6933